ncbi:MAG: sulfotransferase [Planctomycetaceae bacterium]
MLKIHTDDGLERPPMPPQKVSKYKSSIQFPKCLTKPFRQKFVAMADRGWFGDSPLQTHLVMCGFPRSGSTLLQLMIEACVADVRTYGRERRGMEAAKCYRRTHPIMMTKRPSDIFTLHDLRSFYENHQANVKFVLQVRDPRAILTSFHHAKPDEYYVPADRWAGIYSYWKWAIQADDVTVVRYEDLVANPERIQQQLSEFLGWNVVHPFADFHSVVPAGFDTRALNGVRKLDPANINRWQEPKYREKLVRLLDSELPDLPEYLVELGYEANTDWARAYQPQCRAA